MPDVDKTVRAFNKYGRDANAELRDAAQRQVNRVTPMLAAGLAASSAQGALVATTITAKRDRYPVIRAGGTKRVGRRRVAAGDVFFGAEFGGRGRPTTQQFRPWRGTTGYGFYPALRQHGHIIIDGYKDTLDQLAVRWGRGG